MFIRVFRPREQKELLINIAHASLIEVLYGVGSVGDYWRTTLEEGLQNPEAVRWYKIHVAGDVFQIVGNPDDPVAKVIEEIYKSAVKA